MTVPLEGSYALTDVYDSYGEGMDATEGAMHVTADQVTIEYSRADKSRYRVVLKVVGKELY